MSDKEQEMHDLLCKTIQHYYRLCEEDDKDKMARRLATHFACYGGDATCILMCHYDKNLTAKIRENL
jgi:3-methyladenine DNA glycosylase/8-oxoguanine DNA glycosylase